MYQITYQPSAVELLGEEGFSDALVGAMEVVGTTHHGQHLPVHFTEEGKGRYGLTPRSPRYERQKQKKYGHTKPLVASGELEQATLYGTREIRASRAGGEAEVRITLPQRALIRNPKSDVDVLAELLVVADQELADLDALAGEELQLRIARRAA